MLDCSVVFEVADAAVAFAPPPIALSQPPVEGRALFAFDGSPDREAAVGGGDDTALYEVESLSDEEE